MKVNEYYRASSLEDAYRKLQEDPRNVILAGGLWIKKIGQDLNALVDLSTLGVNKISENETYFIKDENKDKLLTVGSLSKSGHGDSSKLRGLYMYVDLQNCTMSGTVSYDVKDPYYTKAKASDIIGNEGGSRVLKRQVLNYEGCPIVKCDNNGRLRIVLKWKTNLTEQNYVQTGINKTGFGNGAACIIDPNLTTNLPNNVVEADKDITVEINDVKKDDIIWMKGIPVTGQYADLDIISVSIIQDV